MRLVSKWWMCTVFLLYINTSYSQKINVHWGNKVDSKFNIEVDRIIGQDDEGFYLMKFEVKGAIGKALMNYYSIGLYNNDRAVPYLEKCNFKCDPIFTEKLVFPTPDGKENKDITIADIFVTGDDLTMFSTHYDKKKDFNYAYCNKVSSEGKPDKRYIEVGRIHSDKKNNTGNFDFIASMDSSKFLVYHNDPFKRKEKEKFGFKVIDEEANTLWEKDIVLPYKDKDVEIVRYAINDEGRVYLLARFQEGNRTRKGGRPNYKFFIVSYNEGDAKPKEYELSLGEDFISDVSFEVTPDNHLVCAGFYSEKNADGATGSFYLRINSETKEIEESNVKEFDANTRAQLMPQRRAKKGKELYDYEIRNLIIREDGGVVIVGEQYYVDVVTTTTTNSSGGSTSSTTYYYNYNALLVVNINPEGQIEWATAIPKYQRTANDGGYYSSYAMAVYKDKMIFVYNDHKKNMAQKDYRKMKLMNRIKKSYAVAVVLDSEGNYQKHQLLDNKKNKGVWLRPKVSLQTSSDQLVLVAKKRNGDYMLGSVTFE